MTPGQVARLMRVGGIASAVSGTLHLAGSARTLAARGGGYVERGPWLFLIGFLLISSGLTVVWAARGVREGAPWARGAMSFAALQAGGLVAAVTPGFVVHLNALSVAPVIVAGAHVAFLWMVRAVTRPAAEPPPR
jgi:hypothetical protein